MVRRFIVLTLTSMWNLLASYAGLVPVGQQAPAGLGAYFVLFPEYPQPLDVYRAPDRGLPER
jgi:ABC-type branched-subunit amino acid transport system permease subunit